MDLVIKSYNGMHLPPHLLNQIMEIENDSYDYPWLPNDFQLRGYTIYVGTIRGKVVGYCVLQQSYARDPSIECITVSEPHRRKGIASKFLEHIMKLSDNIVLTRTIAGNLPAQLLFKKMGFICNKTSYEYYTSDFEELELETYHFIFRKSWTREACAV